MTTIREDVLLQVAEVRFKKGDGVLYVMNERIAWIATNRNTFAVSHYFKDIKMQKISPDGKPKIQLQVVLHDNNSSTFHFVNRQGQGAQVQDRDKVKELLQQLLPNFKRKVDKELEEKNRLLTENPALLQLYKDLVITQVITSEEFWDTHAAQFTQKEGAQKQNIGVSGAFLADIKPQTDGCNGLKYNLTADIIECIFKTYPAVKRKHTENVPSKMTESEFWTKFFQSHYFHRDRITAGTKDIFSECGKIDDQALKLAVAENAGDPLLDLRTFEDNTLEEGFGGSAANKSVVNSGNIVHQNMIKRFNQHSFMVLKTCTDVKTLNASPEKIKATAIATTVANNNNSIRNNNHQEAIIEPTNGELPSDAAAAVAPVKEKKLSKQALDDISTAASNSIEPERKRKRIMEKMAYTDLGDEVDEVGGKKRQAPPLNLTKVERYLHGPMPTAAATNSLGDLLDDEPQQQSLMDLDAVTAQIYQETHNWHQRTPHKVLVSATAAVNALGELSPGGFLMRGYQEQSLAQLVPPDIEKELRNLYLSLCELLKHFWKCFPPTTPELEARAARFHGALQRYQMAKLKSFEDRAIRELAPLGTSLTLHLNQLIQSANRKFATWHERKMKLHR